MKIDYTLYLCTDSNLMSTNTIEESIEQAILGGVSIVQIREKDLNTKEFIKVAKRVKNITDKYNIPLIVNDRVDIALLIDSSGVHLGQEDMSCKDARRILGENKIIGISVSNHKEAIKAIKDGADYLGVGAMFKSKTKPEAKIVKITELKKIRKLSSIPIVVIGGINRNTIPLFKNIKIDGYAMIRPIISNEDIKKATYNLLNVIKKTSN